MRQGLGAKFLLKIGDWITGRGAQGQKEPM